MYEFEWDINKSIENEKKHGISFNEAVSVFGDIYAIYFEDFDHSLFEQRNKIIGLSSKNNLLLVVFTERSDKVRIISSRKLTTKERKDYENNQS